MQTASSKFWTQVTISISYKEIWSHKTMHKQLIIIDK